MRTVTTKVFKFDELSAEVQDLAVDKIRSKVAEILIDFEADDYRDALAAIQKALNENRRRQVFRAVGNAGAGVLSVSPAAEDTATWGGIPGTVIRASSGTPGRRFRGMRRTWRSGWRPSSREQKGGGTKN